MVSEPTFQTSSIFPTKGPLRTLGRTLSSLLSEEPPRMLSYYPRSAFPLIEDCIGEESCVDLMPGLFDMPMKPDSEAAAMERVLRMERRKEAAEEYPPLIPLLARTGNQPSHMPWVLKRTYTDDGRLILQEERVRHHEYFRAHRCNGRLTLQLIPLNDEVFDPETETEAETEADHEPNSPIDNNDRSEAEVINGEDTNEEEPEEDSDREFVDSADDKEESAVVTTTAAAAVEIGGGSGGKCLKGYNIGGGVNVNGASSCIFGVAVPAL